MLSILDRFASFILLAISLTKADVLYNSLAVIELLFS